MSRSRVPTRLSDVSNTVLVVGSAGRLVDTTRHAALGASGALVMSCDVSRAATLAAEHRPYALVLSKEVYEFGGPEFDALARDVDAQLVVVAESVQQGVLTALLGEASTRLG